MGGKYIFEINKLLGQVYSPVIKRLEARATNSCNQLPDSAIL